MPVLTGRALRDLRRGDLADIHVVVDEAWSRLTRTSQPFLILRVSDLSASATAYVFSDQRAFTPAGTAQRGDVVKLRVRVDKAGDAIELKAIDLRVASDADVPLLASVFGDLRLEAVPVAAGTVGFDIETAPRLDLDALPERERVKLLASAADDARRERRDPDAADIARSVSKLLALSPLTTRIVSLAFHALESNRDLTLVAVPAGSEELELPPQPTLLFVEERELLTTFWGVARRVRTLVGFNSRRFDVPVLLTRSALLGVAAAQDLMNRPVGGESKHVDLYEILRAHGAAGDRRVSLELAAFAFGIPAKQAGHGSEVGALVAAARYRELAAYNLEDARATAMLYGKLRGTWV